MSAECPPKSLIGRLFYHAETSPDHDAIVTPTLTLSYTQLAQLVRAQVKEYNNAGISGDSIIGIKCADDTQHLVLCLAAMHFGATSCTVPSYEAELAQSAVKSRCGTTHVVDESIPVVLVLQNLDIMDCNVESATMETPAREACLLFSTSGTTGEPKLVVHHDSDLVAQAHRHVASEQERFVCLASMEQNFVKRHRLYCVAVGATNIFLDAEQQLLVAQCQSLNVNVIHVSAFQAQELLAIPNIGRLSNIRLKLGGSHVPLSLRQQLRNNITHNLQAGYGTTETGAIAFTDSDDFNAGESVGQALPGIEIRTVTPERKPLSNGKRGELAIRCNGMFRGYLGKTSLTTTQLEDGWFYTGDIGYLDKQQRIHLCGRSDDMFVFNSMNIYPQDIESQLCQHPDIIDAAVLPKTSSVHGNIPVALIVFAKDIKPDLPALKKFVRERTGVRSPRQFTIVDEIPRNATGKISRSKAMSLSAESDQIRGSIVQALSDAHALDNLKPSLVAAFVNGDKDIRLHEIGMDSLARMELLIVLEMDYGRVIMPHEFAQLHTLDDIVSQALLPSQDEVEQNVSVVVSDENVVSTQPALAKKTTSPYVVRLFQRVFRYCNTVAQLNKALVTLEKRLTPMEVECLHDWHFSSQLLPSSTTEKFQKAFTHWIQNMKRMMLSSGKQQPEPFVLHRIASTVTHFVGPGPPADKTLLICFAAKGVHHLLIPNAVLMQHSDSACYDLLIIHEPLRASYRLGVPLLGNNLAEVIEWLAKLDLITDYSRIRTLGCSAGGYAAVVAGYRLAAEMSVCVGGRFPTERHPIRILNMVFTHWRAVRKGYHSRVIMSYDADKTRDRNYAKIMARICGGNLVAVEVTNEKVGHRIFECLVERGELAPYLAHTLFAEMNDKLISAERANVIMSFPSIQIRPYG